MPGGSTSKIKDKKNRDIAMSIAQGADYRLPTTGLRRKKRYLTADLRRFSQIIFSPQRRTDQTETEIGTEQEKRKSPSRGRREHKRYLTADARRLSQTNILHLKAHWA